jgi:hypothetical protein
MPKTLVRSATVMSLAAMFGAGCFDIPEPSLELEAMKIRVSEIYRPLSGDAIRVPRTDDVKRIEVFVVEDGIFSEPFVAIRDEGALSGYAVPGVPLGREVYVRYEFYGGVGNQFNRTSQYLVTSSPEIDLTEYRVGRPDGEPAGRASLVFNVDNMTSWSDGDALTILANDAFVIDDAVASGGPESGATSLHELSFDWLDKPLIEPTAERGLRLLHRRVRPAGDGQLSDLVAEQFEATTVAQEPSGETVVEGSFAPLPVLAARPIDWEPDRLLEALSSSTGRSLQRVGSRLSIVAGHSNGLELFAASNTPFGSAVAVPIPLEGAELRRRAEIRAALDGASGLPVDESLTMSVEELWDGAAPEVRPLLAPPRDVRMNGASLEPRPVGARLLVDLASSSAGSVEPGDSGEDGWGRGPDREPTAARVVAPPLTVTWSPARAEPELTDDRQPGSAVPCSEGGGATAGPPGVLYRIRLFRVIDDDGRAERTRVMTLVTKSTRFTVPPDVLAADALYYFKITAEYERCLTASAPFMVGSLPRAVAETATGLFTTFRPDQPSPVSQAPRRWQPKVPAVEP